MPEPKAALTKPIGNAANYTNYTNYRLNYHPDYGFPNVYRVRVIESALLLGVAAAALSYNVGQSTIYKWLADIKATHRATTRAAKGEKDA